VFTCVRHECVFLSSPFTSKKFTRKRDLTCIRHIRMMVIIIITTHTRYRHIIYVPILRYNNIILYAYIYIYIYYIDCYKSATTYPVLLYLFYSINGSSRRLEPRTLPSGLTSSPSPQHLHDFSILYININHAQ